MRLGRPGRKWLAWAILLAPLIVVLLTPFLAPALAQAGAPETQGPAPAARQSPEVMKWGFIAAALVTGLSALGAAYAVAVVGGAAMGAVAEKPETAGRALVFVGLAEGIAIYGLIVAIMILGYLT
jgi:V/A-type H+-transporting ATPase subunit K